jgi:hypothetical protein
MEIVLLWLDELDDLVFAGFSLWGRLRRACLAVALTAAIAVHALPRLGVAVVGLWTLHDAALAALAIWGIFALVSAAAARSRHSMAGGA